ncbi:MAG: cyclic nucleotide-binding domain-containing protein, partial [Nitrospirae bacterium]|nr:cyclic nucleotide-binding domain-containing protein [Nitrospirota bacterium]
MTVLVLEKGELVNTIYEYQKKKHVMDEPREIPLEENPNNILKFRNGSRERILNDFKEGVTKIGLEVRCFEVVNEIQKNGDVFTVRTEKESYESQYVIMAIGVRGNPRKLNVPGEDLPHVFPRLDDPEIYENEDILLVGAGDAAVEGVLALCEKNRVSVVNRGPEFIRLKDALDTGINQKMASGEVKVYFNAGMERIEEGSAFLKLPDSIVKVKADIVIKQIGAEMPRRFLEGLGITFKGANPELDEKNESTIPGLYFVGAVTGQDDLIKPGMNQGVDAVEYILGHPHITMADKQVDKKLAFLPNCQSTRERLAAIQHHIPLVAEVSYTQLRGLILGSTIHQFKQSGNILFEEGDYSDSFYMILHGSVEVTFKAQGERDKPVCLQRGAFLGEVSLMSGRRRSGTAKILEPSILIETPRKAMLRVMNSEPSLKRFMDEAYMTRAFLTHLLPDADPKFLVELARKATICSFKAEEVVFKQGDIGDALYLIRQGSVKISKQMSQGDREVVVSYVPAGRYFGEMALMDPAHPERTATVTATKYTEAIKLAKEDFESMLHRHPDFEKKIRSETHSLLLRGQEVAIREITGQMKIDRMMKAGVFEGTDVLLIDENKCIRCDQCVTACADTHDGQTRLYRTEGLIFANILVPNSCRHCENPLCLTDCVAGDAILRDPKGEVYINEDKCIGCENCMKNCPYGNIQMMEKKKSKQPLSSLWDWLPFLKKTDSLAEPEEEVHAKIAVKCDLCADRNQGPACVRACPTGAALRVSPEDYFKKVGLGAF